MMKQYPLFLSVFIYFQAHAIKPQLEDLNSITIVKEKRKNGFLILKAASLDKGFKLKYRETLEGENAGFATCRGLIPHAQQSLVNEEKDADYWGDVLKLKLKELGGTSNA